jgi:hypothetical protein
VPRRRLTSHADRLKAANELLERTQTAKAELSGQLGEAAHEVWEGALQQRLRREQAEALEARLGFLETEIVAKDERLRGAEHEAAELRASVRKQQQSLAEAEQALQKVRVVEVPAMREDVRREESRAVACEAKLTAVEAQLSAAHLSLAEARQAAIDREQAVAQARSLQLAAELRLADADQRIASEARRAAVAEAEARGAVERHAALQDAHAETRALLRRRDEALAEARQREKTREEVEAPLAQTQLDEAIERSEVLTASLRGREERHTALLETLGSLRRALAEREARVHELTEARCCEFERAPRRLTPAPLLLPSHAALARCSSLAACQHARDGRAHRGTRGGGRCTRGRSGCGGGDAWRGAALRRAARALRRGAGPGNRAQRSGGASGGGAAGGGSAKFFAQGHGGCSAARGGVVRGAVAW